MKKCNTCHKIKDFDCFNKQSLTKDGYRGRCKECRKIDTKNYNLINYDIIKEKQKLYYDEHNESILEQKKDYRSKNVKIIKKKQKIYREENKEKLKEYYQINKLELNKKRRVYIKNKLKTDPLFKLKHNLACLIRISIKSNGFTKKSRTNNILGCSFEEFKEHIESQWEDWMNWDNYGKYNGELSHGWDIDHIIPISSAINERETLKLNHYNNLQPLCSKINRDIKRSMWQGQLKNKAN